MAVTKTRTLQLEFLDGGGNSVVYSLKDTKEGLHKATDEAAAQTIVEKKVFATADGDLASLKQGQIVTRSVETIDE